MKNNIKFLYFLFLGFCFSQMQILAVEKFDKKEDIFLLNQQAAHWQVDAQFQLGLMYDDGESISQDRLKAVRWWTKAAEQGHVEAQLNLGLMYTNGVWVPQDDSKAGKWLKKAGKQGQVDAQLNLGLIYADGVGIPRNK